MSGVEETGFVTKTYEEILADVQESIRTDLQDPNIAFDPTLPLGQLLGILAKTARDHWELSQVVHNSIDPRKAQWFQLDTIGALRGIPRRGPAYSTVVLNVTLTNGTTLLSGTHFANVTGQPTNRWTPVANYTANYTGVKALLFRAVDYGAAESVSGTTWTITQPVTGWSAITQTTDSDPGRLVETDTAYLARQELEIAQPGSSTIPAVRAAVLEVDRVKDARVFENFTNVTDADGLPAHSMNVLIWDGATNPEHANGDEIAQAMWDNKGGGIPFESSTSPSPNAGVAIDSEGVYRTILFQRAQVVPIYMAYTLTVDSTFPVDGADLVKKAAIDLANKSFSLGTAIVALLFRSAAFKVQGVLDVPAFTIGTAPAPVGTSNIPIGIRQHAFTDTSMITVTT